MSVAAEAGSAVAKGRGVFGILKSILAGGGLIGGGVGLAYIYENFQQKDDAAIVQAENVRRFEIIDERFERMADRFGEMVRRDIRESEGRIKREMKAGFSALERGKAPVITAPDTEE